MCHLEEATPSSIDPHSVGEIRVKLTYTFGTKCTATEAEEAVTSPKETLVNFDPIRVNEEDKKPGAHCVMWVLSNIF